MPNYYGQKRVTELRRRFADQLMIKPADVEFLLFQKWSREILKGKDLSNMHRVCSDKRRRPLHPFLPSILQRWRAWYNSKVGARHSIPDINTALTYAPPCNGKPGGAKDKERLLAEAVHIAREGTRLASVLALLKNPIYFSSIEAAVKQNATTWNRCMKLAKTPRQFEQIRHFFKPKGARLAEWHKSHKQALRNHH